MAGGGCQIRGALSAGRAVSGVRIRQGRANGVQLCCALQPLGALTLGSDKQACDDAEGQEAGAGSHDEDGEKKMGSKRQGLIGL